MNNTQRQELLNKMAVVLGGISQIRLNEAGSWNQAAASLILDHLDELGLQLKDDTVKENPK